MHDVISCYIIWSKLVIRVRTELIYHIYNSWSLGGWFLSGYHKIIMREGFFLITLKFFEIKEPYEPIITAYCLWIMVYPKKIFVHVSASTFLAPYLHQFPVVVHIMHYNYFFLEEKKSINLVLII